MYTFASCVGIENGFVAENGVPVYVFKGQKRVLPRVAGTYRELLDMQGVSYREVDIKMDGRVYQMLEVYDPDYYEEEEIVAPAYSKEYFKYRCVNPRYHGKAITQETLDAAIDVYEQVSKLFDEYDDYLRLRRYMNDKKAAIVLGHMMETGVKDLFGHHFAVYQVLFKDGYSGYIGVSSKPYITIIMDLDTIEEGEDILIEVPEGISIGKLVGVNAWQIWRMKQVAFNKVGKITFAYTT